MSIFDKIQSLCVESNITIAKLERELNMSNGTIRKWKISTPRSSSLDQIAKYFHVTTDYLLGNIELSDSDPFHEDLRRVVREAYQKGLSAQDLQLAIDFIIQARGREKS